MPLPSPDQLRAAAATLKRQSQALDALAAAVDPPVAGKVAAAWAAWEKAGSADLAALADVPAWMAEEKAGRRERLSHTLRASCEKAGVELAVVTRDPLELRLAPLGVSIDVEANRAALTFGRQELAVAEADSDAILRARADALTALEATPWEPAAFHARLRRAWSRSAASPGDWAEIAEVLPELVFLSQSRAFRADPSARRFEPYSRAQLCYDLWRLRRDRVLTQDGWRLTVAPATGASTKDKSRVFWLEDDRGQGQWHLTLRFVREEPHAG